MATIESLINTVQQHGYANELAEAEEHGRLALEAIAELRRQGSEHAMQADAHEARLRNILAVVAVISGDHAVAVEMADEAMAAAERANRMNEVATALGTLGLVYDELTDYPKALDYHERSLKLNEQLNDEMGIARCISNIGGVCYKIGNFDQAMVQFQRVYDWLEGQRRQRNEDVYDKQLAGLISNIGGVYFSRQDDDQALLYFERALAMNEAGNDAHFICINLSNIGGVHVRQRNIARATDTLARAFEIAEANGFLSSAANSLTRLGELIGDAKKIERAITISAEIGDQLQLHESHFALGRVLEAEGDAVQALHHFKEGRRLEQEYLGAEAQHQARLLEHRQQIEASERDRQVKLARFQEQEKILHNILPSQIADRILEGEKTIADHHDNVSVFFSDIVGFTTLSQTMSAGTLVTLLNDLFSDLDRLAAQHGLEKIKTIGDAYMAVAGIPTSVVDHADRALRFATDALLAVRAFCQRNNLDLQIRIGLHSGPVVAGVIGESKFAYDLWGDTVNTASRMESHGEPGKIHASDDFVRALTQTTRPFIDRGMIDVKGKGAMRTYLMGE